VAKKKSTADLASEEAVTAALKEGHREFLRFVARRVSNIADAEDLLQDFYLKVVRSARTVRNKGSLRSWLAQVLRWTVTDYYRKKSVRTKAQERLKAERGSALIIDDEAEQAVCGCLYRILPTLPAAYGQIIWRIDLLGEARDRVAKNLGITANSLDVRVHRARQSLRAALLRFCTTCPTHGFLNCACEEGSRSRAERAWFESAPTPTVMDRPAARRKPRIRAVSTRLVNRRRANGNHFD
jgi:RNA polymerase sigma-70 factor (ECF subfamily)